VKSFLICNDQETLVGMRLAGVQGIILNDRTEVLSMIERKIKDDETGIIILTKAIMQMAEKEIMAIKLKSKFKLIVEIPGAGLSYEDDYITRHIRESIGIKI
jgi:V/A-type H+-transporting ATPase subunit F